MPLMTYLLDRHHARYLSAAEGTLVIVESVTPSSPEKPFYKDQGVSSFASLREGSVIVMKL